MKVNRLLFAPCVIATLQLLPIGAYAQFCPNAAVIKAEIKKWAKVVAAAGLRAE